MTLFTLFTDRYCKDMVDISTKGTHLRVKTQDAVALARSGPDQRAPCHRSGIWFKK